MTEAEQRDALKAHIAAHDLAVSKLGEGEIWCETRPDGTARGWTRVGSEIQQVRLHSLTTGVTPSA